MWLSGFSIHKYSHAVWHLFLVQSCLWCFIILEVWKLQNKTYFYIGSLVFQFYPIYFSSFSFLTDSSVKLLLTGSSLQWPPFWTLTEFSLYSHYNLILLIPKYVHLNSYLCPVVRKTMHESALSQHIGIYFVDHLKRTLTVFMAASQNASNCKHANLPVQDCMLLWEQ